MPFVPVSKSYGSSGPPISSYLPPGSINSMLLGRLDIPGGLYSGSRSPLSTLGGYGYGYGAPSSGILGSSYTSTPSYTSSPKFGKKYGLSPISEHSSGHQRVSRPPKFNHITAYSKPLEVPIIPRRPAGGNRFATFNTEDIDVTTPRRPSRDETAEKPISENGESAEPEENMATPGAISRDRDNTFGTIRRNRTVIRIQTQHLKENPYLVTEERRDKKPKKTTGEKLKEKWAIHSKKKKHSGYRKPSLTDIQAQQEILRREIEARQAALMQRRADRASSLASEGSSDGLTKSQEEEFFNNPEKIPRRKSTKKFLIVRQMSQENLPGGEGLLGPDVIPIPISRSGSTAGLLPVDLAIPEESSIENGKALIVDDIGDEGNDDDDGVDFWATPGLRSNRSTLVIRSYFKPIRSPEMVNDSSEVESIHEEEEEENNCDLEIESIMKAGKKLDGKKQQKREKQLKEMSEIFAGAKLIETDQDKGTEDEACVDRKKTVKKVRKKISDTAKNIQTPGAEFNTADTNGEPVGKTESDTTSVHAELPGTNTEPTCNKKATDAAKEQVQVKEKLEPQSTTTEPSACTIHAAGSTAPEKQMPENADSKPTVAEVKVEKTKVKPKPFKLPSDVKESPNTSPSKIAGKAAIFNKFETKSNSPSPTPSNFRKPEFVKAKSPGSPKTEPFKPQSPMTQRPAFVKAKSPGSPKVLSPLVAHTEVPKLDEAAEIIAELENKSPDGADKESEKVKDESKEAQNAHPNKQETPVEQKKTGKEIDSKGSDLTGPKSPLTPKPPDSAKLPAKFKAGHPIIPKDFAQKKIEPTTKSATDTTPKEKVLENVATELASPTKTKPADAAKTATQTPAPTKQKITEQTNKPADVTKSKANGKDEPTANPNAVTQPTKEKVEEAKKEQVPASSPSETKTKESKLPTPPPEKSKTDSPKPTESPAVKKAKVAEKRSDSPSRKPEDKPKDKLLLKKDLSAGVKVENAKTNDTSKDTQSRVNKTANLKTLITDAKTMSPEVPAAAASKPEKVLTDESSSSPKDPQPTTGTLSTTKENKEVSTSIGDPSQSNLDSSNKTNALKKPDQSSPPAATAASSLHPNQVEPPKTPKKKDNNEPSTVDSAQSAKQTENNQKPTKDKPKISPPSGKDSPAPTAADNKGEIIATKSKKKVFGLQNRLNSREKRSIESSDSSEAIVQLKTSVDFVDDDDHKNRGQESAENTTSGMAPDKSNVKSPESENKTAEKPKGAKKLVRKSAVTGRPAAKSNLTTENNQIENDSAIVTEVSSISEKTKSQMIEVSTSSSSGEKSQVEIDGMKTTETTTIISETTTETVIESAVTTAVLPNPIVQSIIRDSRNRHSSEGSSGSVDGDSPPLTPKSSERDGSTSTTSSSTLSAGTSGSSRRMPSPPSDESDEDQETIARRICPTKTRPKFRRYEVDDFQFLKCLGKGSFGKVLLAELKGTDCYFAVKCLKKDVVLEDDDVECTMIERKVLLMGSKHPYLCHLLCTFQTESHLFFVMEYLNGGDLMFHIQQTGRFTEDRARFYGAEIVSGLKFLHKKGIIYRDLKLDNILLDFEGHVRIADFGMCKLQIYLDRTADTFCGTPDYMAPEIIKGLKYNQCVDWWAFGILLYEMLIGQSPFSGCDEDELFWSICNESVRYPRFLSRESKRILEQLLEKDASKRLGTTGNPHGEVKEQQFFASINWDKLERRELEPPFKPKLKHSLDVQYFDTTFTKENPRLTPVDKEILRSMDQTQFDGFSYTNPHTTD